VKFTLVGVLAIILVGLALTVNAINGGKTVMVLAGVMSEVLPPDEVITVSVGYHVPALYVWTGLVLDVLFSQVPSPKLQFQVVRPFPVEVSVNVTANGAVPDVVLTVKLAIGSETTCGYG